MVAELRDGQNLAQMFKRIIVVSHQEDFAAAFPVVLPSTIDSAFDLTISNAASGSYTLGVMTVVAAVSLPFILAYQAWSYWVFRKRVAPHHLPDPHDVVPAVRPDAVSSGR